MRCCGLWKTKSQRRCEKQIRVRELERGRPVAKLEIEGV
jgi:hypothetical protein